MGGGEHREDGGSEVCLIQHGELPYLSPDQQSELSGSPSAHLRQLSDPPSGGTSSGWLLSSSFV